MKTKYCPTCNDFRQRIHDALKRGRPDLAGMLAGLLDGHWVDQHQTIEAGLWPGKRVEVRP